MDTREIAREQWTRFFDDFSRSHEGWIVSLEVLGLGLGAQEEATGLPLMGISADVKGRASRVEVIVGNSPDAHATRIIELPQRVWLKEPDEMGQEAIEVQSDDGTTTLLRFRLIQQVDHLLPAEIEGFVPQPSMATAMA